jgi:hypothetical protein
MGGIGTIEIRFVRKIACIWLCICNLTMVALSSSTHRHGESACRYVCTLYKYSTVVRFTSERAIAICESLLWSEDTRVSIRSEPCNVDPQV